MITIFILYWFIYSNPCYYDFEIYSEASTTGGRRKTQNYENRAVHFYRCAGILRSMLYALCDHVKILSTNLQYLEGFAIIFSSKRKEVSYVRLIWKHKQIKKHTF